MKTLINLFLLVVWLFPQQTISQTIPSSRRSRQAIERVLPDLQDRFKQANLELGSSVFLRIFKQTDELEVWVKNDTAYQLFNTYEICDFSGGLGTKTREGDKKSPEGFYTIKPNQLNPHSSFHLSFNIGYPNKLEQSLSYTGSAIMVHGNCVSVGCYAMTDSFIEEIWTIIVKAFAQGQKRIPLHIFPFRLTDEKLDKMQNYKDYNLWLNMQPGFQYFENNHLPPRIIVRDRRYTLAP